MASNASACSGDSSISSAPGDALELDPAGDAVLHGRLEQLVEHRPHLALGLQAGEERHRLALEQPERRGDARLPERLHEQGLEGLEQLGRAREVGAEHEHAPLERGGHPHDGVEQLPGLRVGRPPQDEHPGHLEGAVERFLEGGRVDLDDEPTGHRGGRRGRLAGDRAGRHPAARRRRGRRGQVRRRRTGRRRRGCPRAGWSRSWVRLCQRGAAPGFSGPCRRRAARGRR